MLHRAYSVFDRKSLVYSPPFYSHTDSSAVRALSDGVADVRSAIGAHPMDYVLFFVGTYDDAKGRLEPISPLVHVIDAVALVKAPPPDMFTLKAAPNGVAQDDALPSNHFTHGE